MTRIRELSEAYGLKADPNASFWQLSVGERQRVEIIKALYRGASLIILDEPTAVLTPQEVNDLFITLKWMGQEGHSLVLISHKLHEVMAISDRVTVLRDGVVIGTRQTREVTRDELVQMMVGRELKDVEPRPHKSGPVRLKVQGLQASGDRGTEALHGIDLQIHAGEILGLAGVSGNGQRELAECLAGMRKPTAGRVLIGEEDITDSTLNQRVDADMAYIPEERMRDGAIREFSVEENLYLHDHSALQYTHGIFLDFAAMVSHAAEVVNEFTVKTPSLSTPLKNLSGGNIQKLILARELSRRPEVLVAAQPTRGVDIGASKYIHQRLLAQREAGTAILLISEDLDEVLALSDRIAVIYEGRIMSVLRRSEAGSDSIGRMMASVGPGEAHRQI